MKHLPLSECPRCKQVDRYHYSDMLYGKGDGIPGALMDLVGDTMGTGMYQNITRCPDCGAYYSNTNECGFMENDIEVNRISPTEAGHELSDEDIKIFKKDLDHPDAKSREYAAECLLDYYSQKGLMDEITKLFKTPDKAIRLNAVVCLLRRDKKKYIALYKNVFENDPDSQVRSNASRYFLYNDEAVAPMIPFFVEKLKDPEVKYSAATVLDAYLYDNPPDRNKAIKDEIKKQKVDLSDPVFEYLRKKLN